MDVTSDAVSPENLKILPEDRPGRFRLIGELEATTVGVAARCLGDELRAGRRLYLDLSGVSFMDNQGLGLLRGLRALAEKRNLAPLVLVTPSSIVRKALCAGVPRQMAGLEIWANKGI